MCRRSRGGPTSPRWTRATPNLLQQSAVASFAGAHSGEDVAVWADGPGDFLFSGSLEQSALYHAMVEALGWNAARQEADESADASTPAPEAIAADAGPAAE